MTSQPSYWDTLHTGCMPNEWDWYVDASQFVSLLRPHLLRSYEVEILIPGCGMSALPRLLKELGFRNVTCVDSSETAIRAQRARNVDEAFDFALMDVTNLADVPSNTLDLIADKALLDALLASGPSGTRLAQRYLSECARMLKPNVGVLVIVSHSIAGRHEALKAAGLHVSGTRQLPKSNVVEFGSSDQFHVFFCTAAKGMVTSAAVPHQHSNSGGGGGGGEDDDDIL